MNLHAAEIYGVHWSRFTRRKWIGGRSHRWNQTSVECGWNGTDVIRSCLNSARIRLLWRPMQAVTQKWTSASRRSSWPRRLWKSPEGYGFLGEQPFGIHQSISQCVACSVSFRRQESSAVFAVVWRIYNRPRSDALVVCAASASIWRRFIPAPKRSCGITAWIWNKTPAVKKKDELHAMPSLLPSGSDAGKYHSDSSLNFEILRFRVLKRENTLMNQERDIL